MGKDDEWVANVKRWCQEQATSRAVPPSAASDLTAMHEDIGYETAHPALQARHCPDAATSV